MQISGEEVDMQISGVVVHMLIGLSICNV